MVLACSWLLGGLPFAERWAALVFCPMRTKPRLATACAVAAALTVGAGSASAAAAQPKTVAAARVALTSEMTALKNRNIAALCAGGTPATFGVKTEAQCLQHVASDKQLPLLSAAASQILPLIPKMQGRLQGDKALFTYNKHGVSVSSSLVYESGRWLAAPNS